MKVELRKIRSEYQARYWAGRLVCELERLRVESVTSKRNNSYCLATDGDFVVAADEWETWGGSLRREGWIDISLVHDNPYWDRHERYNSLGEKITALAECLMWLADRKEFRDALHATKFSPADVDAGIIAWKVMDTDAENYYLGEYLADMCGVYRDDLFDTYTVTNMRNYAYEHGMII